MRGPIFCYYFINFVYGYLKSSGTKKFEGYNDITFEIIGYLADWGRCSSGSGYNDFGYYKQETAEEFKQCAMRELTENYEDNLNVRTKMTVEEIEEVFLARKLIR